MYCTNDTQYRGTVKINAPSVYMRHYIYKYDMYIIYMFVTGTLIVLGCLWFVAFGERGIYCNFGKRAGVVLDRRAAMVYRGG